MVIDMHETRLQTISQLQAFLVGTLEVRFYVPDNDDARDAHIVLVAQRFDYVRLNRPDKGVVLRYLPATCGYSRAQLNRLVARALDGQGLRSPVHAFAQSYTPADALLLPAVDRAHGMLSGPVTAHLLKRALHMHGDARIERLASLTMSHLYNLRHSKIYQNQRVISRRCSVALASYAGPRTIFLQRSIRRRILETRGKSMFLIDAQFLTCIANAPSHSL